MKQLARNMQGKQRKRSKRTLTARRRQRKAGPLFNREKKLSSHGTKKTLIFSAFSAFSTSVFTNRVRFNQADNVNNTNNNAFKIEERKQVREYTH